MTRHIPPKPAPKNGKHYVIVREPRVNSHLEGENCAWFPETTVGILWPGIIKNNLSRAERMFKKYTDEYVGQCKISFYERNTKGNFVGKWRKIK